MTDNLDQSLEALGIDPDTLDPDVLDALRQAAPTTESDPMPAPEPPTCSCPSINDLTRAALEGKTTAACAIHRPESRGQTDYRPARDPLATGLEDQLNRRA